MPGSKSPANREARTGLTIGTAGVGLMTLLFLFGSFDQWAFLTGAALFVLAGIAIAALSRLRSISLRQLRLELDAVRKDASEARQEANAVAERVARIYGDVALRPWDAIDHEAIGLGNGRTITNTRSIANYVSGCIRRERWRLARVLSEGNKEGQNLADALQDCRLDNYIFQWSGGAAPMTVTNAGKKSESPPPTEGPRGS